MGLGLAVAREIAHAHRGDLCFQNQNPPPGALVTLTLPLSPPA
jgi:signal transduction histidine kinase